jgi:hypothetical protein
VRVLQAWILLPALLAVLSLGWGLLVERLSARRLPGVLAMPVGLAAIVVVARAAMWTDPTAELATPLVVVGALAGIWLGRERLRAGALDRWAAAAAAVVLAVVAAPIVLSGEATFAGYTVLGDTAVHFVLVDRIATGGTSLDGLDPSSYRQTLEAYFGSGYPLGAHAALGAVRPLAFLDVAWAFQPFIAFVMAMLALSLFGLLEGVVRSPWRRAAVAAVAAQPALVYAYAMQGSIKEIVTLWLVPLLAALVARLPREPRLGLRDTIPLAVASAAGVAAIGVAVAAWLAPLLLVALWIAVRPRPREPRAIALVAGGFAALVALLSLPTLLDLRDYLDVTREVVTAQEELGNLFNPLNAAQVFGIWLTGDFRLLPPLGDGVDALETTYALIGVAAIGALIGLAWLVRRRALGPLLFVAVSVVALVYVVRTGSPWADAKALAIASPAVLLAAALGPLALEARGARIEALVLAVAIAGGVIASNVLVYHDTSLAPADRLEELSEIADRLDGDGPVLYTEFEEMGKHFLRGADPVGAAEAFTVPGLTPNVEGFGLPRFGYPVDVSQLVPAEVSRFEAIVQRRSPDGGRPPDGYQLDWRGRYYELWTRDGDGGRPPRPKPADTFVTARGPLPPDWGPRQDDPTLVTTNGAGRVDGRVRVRRPGVYRLWLRGSFGREVEVLIDGRRAGAVSDELAQPANWIDLGTVELGAGAHRVEIVRGDGGIAPGSGDGPRNVGSLVLTPAGRAS